MLLMPLAAAVVQSLRHASSFDIFQAHMETTKREKVIKEAVWPLEVCETDHPADSWSLSDPAAAQGCLISIASAIHRILFIKHFFFAILI